MIKTIHIIQIPPEGVPWSYETFTDAIIAQYNATPIEMRSSVIIALDTALGPAVAHMLEMRKQIPVEAIYLPPQVYKTIKKENRDCAPFNCKECGCKEGAFHDFLCLQERCPFCGGQLASCDCVYDLLNLKDKDRWTKDTAFLPPDIYQNGISKEQIEFWFEICTKKGRFPYIYYPTFCAYCGLLNPDFFMVSNEEWEAVIEPSMRSKIVCHDCYASIKTKVQKARNKFDQRF